MNVGVWIAGYEPGDGGGYTFETDVLESLATLAEESAHAFTVLSAETRGVHSRPPCESNGLRFVSVRQPGVFERTARHLAEDFGLFRRALRRPSQIESVARTLGLEFIWSVSPGVYRLDLPYLMTVWDLQHRLQPWFPEVTNGGVWRDRETVYSWSLRRAAGVIVGTEAGRGEVERFYQVPSDRIWILPHPTPKFALESEQDGKRKLGKFDIPDGYLLYPAAFWPHKNHVNLLHAARRLRDEDQLILPLVFTGADKGNQGYVHHVAVELGVADQVHFLGFVSREELAALYRNAFALTYVSFFGPENLPPLEAFALGCPVIASDVAGAREQLGDAALFADPSRPEQIAHAIKLLQNVSLRRTLIERGAVRAARWTARDFVKGVFSILDHFEATRRCWGK